MKKGVGIIFLIVILILGIIFFNLFNGGIKKFSSSKSENYSKIEEMHFNHMPLTYYVDIFNEPYSENVIRGESYDIVVPVAVYPLGHEKKMSDIQWAFQVIENATDGLVRFKEVNLSDNPDIKVIGVTPNEMEFFLNSTYNETGSSDGILGIADPVNDSVIIYNGTIYYQPTRTRIDESNWYYGRCVDFPTTEIHETLHILGFYHTNKTIDSVMYPIDYPCKVKKIDDEIVSCLKYIYSNGEIGGRCSENNINPYYKNMTDLFPDYNDFAWPQISLTYSILNCKYPIKITSAIEDFQELSKNRFMFVKSIGQQPDINFICENSSKTNIYYPETDYWSNLGLAMKREYVFDENNKILQANITLYYPEECLDGRENSQFEFVAIYRAIGLRNATYGNDFEYSCGMSSDGSIQGSEMSNITMGYINELYNGVYFSPEN